MKIPIALLIGLLLISLFLLLLVFLLIRKVWTLRRIFVEKASKYSEFSRFLDIFTKSVGNESELKDWLSITADFIRNLVEAKAVCVFVQKGGYLRAEGSSGPFPSLMQRSSNDYVLTKKKYIQENLHRESFKVGEGFIGEIAQNQEEILITNAENDPRLSGLVDGVVPIYTLMAVPIMKNGEVTGVICAVNSRNGENSFTPEQFRRLHSISSQVVLVQNIIDHYSALSQQQRISQELEFARNLQLSLMPTAFPVWGDFTIEAVTRAAKEVSGDFYDFVQIDDNQLLVVIGDACGKGIPACMIMAMTRSFIRSCIGRFTTLKDLVRELNENIYRDTVDERYITLGCCLLNKKDSTIEYARAGHTPLLMFLRQHIRAINPDGAGLGILPGELSDFDTLRTEVSHNTTMLMFTDGINETTNAQDEFFGIPRLMEVYRSSCMEGLEPKEIIARIMEATDNYSEHKEEQDDDQTMVIIRYK